MSAGGESPQKQRDELCEDYPLVHRAEVRLQSGSQGIAGAPHPRDVQGGPCEGSMVGCLCPQNHQDWHCCKHACAC